MQTMSQRAQALIDWIHSARTFGEKNGLDNMRRMLALLGNPHERLCCVHVAGTNGKGSVCALVERALRENGLVTGLYTSPYLMRYQERIRIDGEPVSDEAFVRAGERVRAAAQQLSRQDIRPTAFELGTALAFLLFAEARLDACVIEVGLGGRLDPTNVITPAASIITNIGLDHVQILGGAIEQIALEKAGIIKAGVPVALYPVEPGVQAIIEGVCHERGAPLMKAGGIRVTALSLSTRGASFGADVPGLGSLDVQISLPGRHQVDNALLALCALALLKERFRLNTDKLLSGLEKATWPGRLQWVNERLLLDGAHNEQGAQALCDYARAFLPGRRIVLLTAMMKDKRPDACARILAPIAQAVVATQVDWPRALPAGDLAALYRNLGAYATPEPDAEKALRQAREQAGADGVVLVCGSLYLVGAVLGLCGENGRT